MLDFDLNFRYQDEKVSALKGVSWRIERGKCIVLCGGSGCGKSTLLRCFNGLVPQFYEGKLNGFCRICGDDIEGLSVGEIGELAASVFQDPRSQFFTINSSTEVAFGLENHGVPREEMIKRVDKAFENFSLEKLKDRNVYELSSGERQLVSILSAWAMNTEIMLLDEPAANLDYLATMRLRGLLLDLKNQGKTLVISEHRLNYLSDVADEYWLMSDGKLQKRFTAEEMKALSLEETAALALRRLDPKSVALSEVPLPSHKSAAPLKFEAVNLRFGYKRKGGLLRGVSLCAERGETVGLIGSNGIGKTTLGKLLTGLLKPAGGKILLNGKRANRKALQENAAFVMQEAEFQFFTNSVMNELTYGHEDTPEFRAEVECLLKDFGMWECRGRHPFSLSGGQMQKLSLMIAYFSPKPVVVLDEPTAGLDFKSMESCAALIREMRREKAVFVITHDVELIARVCTRCICIVDERLEREIPLTDNARLRELVGFIENSPQTEKPPHIESKPCRLHPCVKILYWIAVLTVISLTNDPLLYSVYAALTIMTAADGRYGLALAGGAGLAAFSVMSAMLPTSALSFALTLFPRALAVWLSSCALIGKNEVARTLAALRSVHIPEKFIMICSVIFRFFPVLSEDMTLMRQSVRTRRTFQTFGQRLRSLPEYFEILTVPMALRVIRIAEMLSASAETRGISLKRRRSSYIALRFGALDIIILILLIAAIAVGLIYNV